MARDGSGAEDMRTLIITNDSQMFLPGWMGNPKRGVGYEEYKNSLSFGTDQVEVYLPAWEMFGGRFTEIRRLRERLSEMVPTDLDIISGEYGLISSEMTICPYDRPMDSPTEVLGLESRTRFSSDVVRRIGEHGLTVVLLPKAFVSFLLDKGSFECMEHGIVITSPSLFDRFEGDGILLLERMGARVGSKNAERVIGHVRSLAAGIFS
jgi:hypothetical protein